MTTLNNKNAFITGGGSGIGFACAQHFASRGANVLIMGRNTEKLDKAAAELRAAHPNVDIKTHSGDVSIEADVIAAVEQARRSCSDYGDGRRKLGQHYADQLKWYFLHH